MSQETDIHSRAKFFLGVDTGGTFTDFVLIAPSGCRIHKVLSTPHAPELAILQGIADLHLLEAAKLGTLTIVHGSTVATNAALEKKGVQTVYITNSGFADLLTLARQNRPDIYALHPCATAPPVPREWCLEVPCRRDHNGCLVTSLTDQDLAALKYQVAQLRPEAVAINLLYSFMCDEEERQIESALQELAFVCRSSEVLPEYKEYERGMATWLNAWLGPKVAGYLRRLSSGLSNAPLAVMQSSGGTIAAEQAARRAVNLLLSGPAGGLAAAHHIGEQIGQPRLITFDMGGTSTDVALIDGAIRLTTEGRLGDFPVAVPMVDMHTIGAGGGSIARIDGGGLLHVGPESAGADPGPACYGRGGAQPTVTDANVVLGRLRPEGFLGGKMALDPTPAQLAIGRLATDMGVSDIQAAQGIIALANEHMCRALRVISIQKGFDPQSFELCCFGGAGGLHVCELAAELGIKDIIIPANSGVLSAFGMIVAPRQRNGVKTLLRPLDRAALPAIKQFVAELLHSARLELINEGVSDQIQHTASLDCRYQGQSFYLNITMPATATAMSLTDHFHQQHQRVYGHRLDLPVELVNVRLQAEAAPPARDVLSLQATFAESPAPAMPQQVSLPDYGIAQMIWRSRLAKNVTVSGPAIICEAVATTLLTPGWQARRDEFGHLRIKRIPD